MREPPKPYAELSVSELADWVDTLVSYGDVSRVELNYALAEVERRYSTSRDPLRNHTLRHLRDLLRSLLGDGDEPMRPPRFPRGGDMPPRGCGACMCSIERLEDRAERGD